MFTKEEKVISEYTGLNFNEINDLECFEHWLYLRDAFIYNYSSTDEGKSYLEKCWLLQQDSQDRNALRELFGKK